MGWHVLVVDDDRQIRQVVRLQLTQAGFEVIEAENGQQAIEKVREADPTHQVNAIVCDIRMPKVGGVELIDYFRRHHPSLSIIVLTGHIDVQLAVDLMKKGVSDYIVKPVPKEQLIAVVRRAVGNRTLRPAEGHHPSP